MFVFKKEGWFMLLEESLVFSLLLIVVHISPVIINALIAIVSSPTVSPCSFDFMFRFVCKSI